MVPHLKLGNIRVLSEFAQIHKKNTSTKVWKLSKHAIIPRLRNNVHVHKFSKVEPTSHTLTTHAHKSTPSELARRLASTLHCQPPYCAGTCAHLLHPLCTLGTSQTSPKTLVLLREHKCFRVTNCFRQLETCLIYMLPPYIPACALAAMSTSCATGGDKGLKKRKVDRIGEAEATSAETALNALNVLSSLGKLLWPVFHRLTSCNAASVSTYPRSIPRSARRRSTCTLDDGTAHLFHIHNSRSESN